MNKRDFLLLLLAGDKQDGKTSGTTRRSLTE
jgi:hypothetical protein